MPEPSPSFLSDENLRLLLFGGKGGVGKTSTAASAALQWARGRPARRLLVVSTDPAHSLSDAFDQPIGDEIRPINGMSNLFAWEIDASRQLEEFKRQNGEVLKTIAERGAYFDHEDVARFFDLSLPGLDELVAAIELASLVREGRYDLVILDTAPTGHTLRLLALPKLMEDWIRVLNLMLEKDLYVRSVFGHYRPDATDAFLKRMSSALTQLRFVLRDGNATEFVPVTIPEGMSIEETDRLLASLHRFGVRVRTLVVNRVVSPHQCPFCEARRRDQKPYLDEIRIRFSAWNLVWVPLLPWEVQGQQALTSYAQAMLGHELPSLCSAGEPHNKASKSGGEMRTRPGPASIPWQALARRQLVLFGGKGGVGKTTVAAATAVHLARENAGQKTLLFSVDPAHSLSDNLDQRIGNRITPVAGVQGLSALEMGATDLLEELKREYVAEIGEAFDAFLGGTFDVAFDRRVMEELISLTPPGVDELMALLKVMDWMEEGTFDRYILDLAPTGHALRFLEAPGLVRQWFTAVFRLLLKYKGMVHLDRVAELLCDKSRALRSVERLLIDSERCEFIAVAIPEAMPVLETSRLLPRLSGLSVTCRCVMVNMVMPQVECDFCAAVRGDQQRHMEKLHTVFPALTQIPLFPHEVKGIAGLTEIGRAIYGDGDG